MNGLNRLETDTLCLSTGVPLLICIVSMSSAMDSYGRVNK
jgi:hypothetical protein